MQFACPYCGPIDWNNSYSYSYSYSYSVSEIDIDKENRMERCTVRMVTRTRYKDR